MFLSSGLGKIFTCDKPKGLQGASRSTNAPKSQRWFVIYHALLVVPPLLAENPGGGGEQQEGPKNFLGKAGQIFPQRLRRQVKFYSRGREVQPGGGTTEGGGARYPLPNMVK